MSAPCILIQLAAVCRKSWKRKSEIFTARQARRNASETFSGVTESPAKTWSVEFAFLWGTAESACCARLLRYAPFAVLCLGKHNASTLQIHVQPTQPQK